MGVDYVVDLPCAVKSDIPTDRLVGLIKGRNQANTVLELARRDGNQSPPSAVVFGRVLQLPGGTTYEDVSAQVLLDEAAPLYDYEHYCAGCPANVLRLPFGCYGYLAYPISHATEEWLLSRLPGSLDSPAGQLLCAAVKDSCYDGGRIKDMRRQDGTFFERDKPARRTWRRGLARWTLTSDQLLQMLIGLDNVDPEHCAMLALFLGGSGQTVTLLGSASSTTTREITIQIQREGEIGHMHNSDTNRLLGYPADARLLIINADDFGLCHAINEAILCSLRDGVTCSTTLMVPCPWALHAMHALKENPTIPFGVHLTVVCDPVQYRWGPLTPRGKVPSLIDETGYFYSFDRIPAFLAQVQLDELEVEFRAQIETVLAADLAPTHLDWHALRHGGGAMIVELMLRLAHDYGLAMRVAGRTWIDTVQRQGLPSNDYDFLDSFGLETVDKAAHYAQLLHDLPVGLSEWAVHPGIDDAELRAIGALGPEVRQTDFDFLISPHARELIHHEGITLLSYTSLQDVWRARQNETQAPAMCGTSVSQQRDLSL